MRLFLGILLTFVLNLTSFSQNYGDPEYYLIDSLDLDQISESDRETLDLQLSKYHKTDSDTARISITNEIIDNIWDEKIWVKYNDHMLILCNNGLETEEDPELRKYYLYFKGGAINNQGYLLGKTGRNEDAYAHYQEALELFILSEDKNAIALALANIGTIHTRKGDYVTALKYLSKSRSFFEDLNDDYGMGSTATNLAIIYRLSGDTLAALEQYQTGLLHFQNINYEVGMSACYNDLGSLQMTLGQLDKSKANLKKSIEIKERYGDQYGLSHSLTNLGVCYIDQDSLELAESLLKRALTIAEENQHLERIGYANRALSKLYLKRGEYSVAKSYVDEALDIADQMNRPFFTMAATGTAYQVYERMGNYKEALGFYRMHEQNKDSILNKTTLREMEQQQAQYEYDQKKTLLDSQHQKELAVQEEAKKKQEALLYVSIAGGLLLAVFLFIVFNRLKVTRQQKAVIETQKEQVVEAHQELEEKNQEILDSIAYAKRIQSAILPPLSTVQQYLPQSFILYKPKDIVAGDFYWLEHKNDTVLFAAADCTGHGVPGAMVSVICNNGLNRSVREHGLTDPAKILDKTREIVVKEFEKSEEEVKDGMDIALCTLKGNKLSYAGAHNSLWVVRKDSTEIEEYKADKQPIGKFREAKPFKSHEIELNPGDTFYLFSDGYADQFGGEKGKKFKASNFKKLLLSIQDKDMTAQKVETERVFEEWKGELEQLDDVCVIGVRV